MNIIKRFWSKVDKKGPDECWEWSGADYHGYGHFKFRSETHQAHRVSWAIAHKTWPIPVGKMICHTCDNRNCVNPKHLYLGTNTTNQQDRSQLIKEDIRAIRRLYQSGSYAYEDLARIYGVSKGTIGVICRYETWKNV